MLKGPSCFALDYIWRQRGSGQRKVCEMTSYTLQGSYITRVRGVRGDDPTVFLLVTVFVEVNVWRIQL